MFLINGSIFIKICVGTPKNVGFINFHETTAPICLQVDPELKAGYIKTMILLIFANTNRQTLESPITKINRVVKLIYLSILTYRRACL